MSDQRRFARSSRRTLALIGALCLVVGCSSSSDKSQPAESSTTAPKVEPLKPVSVGQDMVQPRRIVASGGTLATTITVRKDAFDVGGVAIKGKSYAGAFVGPTLALRPGNTLRVDLENRLTEATNLHFHGLHVSPDQPSDDVLIHIHPKSTFSYEVKIPANHPSGTFWYHSHQHESSEEQVFGGLSGIIVIEGQTADLPPALRDVTEAEFVLKDTQVTGNSIESTNIDSDAPTTRTVNGQVNPVYQLAPGETQLWRFANVGADIFYELHLAGQQFHVVAEDGNPTWNVWAADRLVLPPGKRFDVLVVGPPAGTYRLITARYNQGGDQYPEVQLATIRTEGTARQAITLPTSVAQRSDLASARVDRRRRLVFSEEDTQSKFMIDGKQFNADRVDQHVKLGAVEEWTIKNATTEQHPFHIHVNDFEVMSIGAKSYDARSLQDTVNLPPGKEVVIRMRFADFTGKFVYHCHILNHEDNGMMGVVQVSR